MPFSIAESLLRVSHSVHSFWKKIPHGRQSQWRNVQISPLRCHSKGCVMARIHPGMPFAMICHPIFFFRTQNYLDLSRSAVDRRVDGRASPFWEPKLFWNMKFHR